MGIYPINCTQCGQPFQWFSGNGINQQCPSCFAQVSNPVQTPVAVQSKPKKHQNQRLSHVEPSWIRKASLTILQRKIKQLLELGKQGEFRKDDLEFLIKAIEASRKLEKDSGDTSAPEWNTEDPNEG